MVPISLRRTLFRVPSRTEMPEILRDGPLFTQQNTDFAPTKRDSHNEKSLFLRAGDGGRTRDPRLGKPMLYH